MNEEADETAFVGPMDGKFCFKKRTDGSIDKSMVVCKLCKKECSIWAFFIKMLVCSMLTRILRRQAGGMLEQSLLKTDLNASLRPGTAVHRVSQIYDKVLPNALPSALTKFLSPSILELYKVPHTSPQHIKPQISPKC